MDIADTVHAISVYRDVSGGGGDLAPTKRCCGFDSRLLLGPVITKTLKMGVVPACMVLMMK